MFPTPAAVLALAALQAAAPAYAPAELFRRVAPSVVVVLALDEAGTVRGQGSGVVLGHGRVATNRHVVEGAARLRVLRGGDAGDAKLLQVDRDRDIAWLGVPWLRSRAPERRPSASLEVGERVYTVGAPQGLELTLAEGLISALRPRGSGRLIQTTAAISAGSSGGGLFDESGRLVGLTAFALRQGQNLNFALPTEWLDDTEVPPALARLVGLRREPEPDAAHLVVETDVPVPYDYFSPAAGEAVLRLFDTEPGDGIAVGDLAGGVVASVGTDEDQVAGRRVLNVHVELTGAARHRIWTEGAALHLEFAPIPPPEPE